MPIPTNYIFTPGSCLKKDFYGTICSLLLGAGWQNVTSNYTTDGDVFISSGNTNDKALIINIRKTETANVTDVTTTNGVQCSIRFPSTYTPGTPGTSGVFTRPGLWHMLPIGPINTGSAALNNCGALDTVYNYKVYVDKSKIIYSIEYPLGINLDCVLIYVGLPDSIYTPESKNNGMVLVSSCYNSGGPASVFVADSPDGIGSTSDGYPLAMYAVTPLKNPNTSNKYILSEIAYGNAIEGLRGKLDGIYVLPNGTMRTGMLIKCGLETYYVVQQVTGGYGGFGYPSANMAIRIA